MCGCKQHISLEVLSVSITINTNKDFLLTKFEGCTLSCRLIFTPSTYCPSAKCLRDIIKDFFFRNVTSLGLSNFFMMFSSTDLYWPWMKNICSVSNQSAEESTLIPALDHMHGNLHKGPCRASLSQNMRRHKCFAL